MCRHIKRHGGYIGVPPPKKKKKKLNRGGFLRKPVLLELNTFSFYLNMLLSIWATAFDLHKDSVYTTLEEFENTALFLRLTVHNNLSLKRRFSKMLFKPEEFSCGPKTFWKQSFSKTMTIVTRMDNLNQVFHFVFITQYIKWCGLKYILVSVSLNLLFFWTRINLYVV